MDQFPENSQNIDEAAADEAAVESSAASVSGAVQGVSEEAEPVETAVMEAEESDADDEAEKQFEENLHAEQSAKAKAVLEADNPAAETAGHKDWYILKVQVNREESIKEHLKRRIQLTGLERYFDEILVPTEKITTMKNGKKRVTKRKLYPGYIMVNMEINDDTWFLVRETSGIGDFTGAAGKPTPMLAHEVQRILQTEKADTEEAPKLKIPYEVGDMVKITDGTFKEIEGEVATIDSVTGRVTVIITIFARSTPVELEYWQVEKVG